MPRPFTETEKQTIRARLFDAALEAARTVGLRRTPVEELARRAGISKGAFYGFFASKEALWMAMLSEAEAELRAALRAEATRGPVERRASAVLRLIFEAVDQHPMLALLADPEEQAWLMRAVPAEVMAAARADDDVFFGELLRDLKASGAVVADVDEAVFAGLPAVALAIAGQRGLIGPSRYEAVRGLVVEGLVARLVPLAPAS